MLFALNFVKNEIVILNNIRDTHVKGQKFTCDNYFILSPIVIFCFSGKFSQLKVH